MNNVVRSLSDKYTDSTVILLCDEIQCVDSSDWSNMETCHNVIWLLAINPSSYGGDMNIVYPTSDDVLSQQLRVKYRNCHQIRWFMIIISIYTLTLVHTDNFTNGGYYTLLMVKDILICHQTLS